MPAVTVTRIISPSPAEYQIGGTCTNTRAVSTTLRNNAPSTLPIDR